MLIREGIGFATKVAQGEVLWRLVQVDEVGAWGEREKESDRAGGARER